MSEVVLVMPFEPDWGEEISCFLLVTAESPRVVTVHSQDKTGPAEDNKTPGEIQFSYCSLSCPCKNGLFFFLAQHSCHYCSWKHSLFFTIVVDTDVTSKYQGPGCFMAFCSLWKSGRPRFLLHCPLHSNTWQEIGAHCRGLWKVNLYAKCRSHVEQMCLLAFVTGVTTQSVYWILKLQKPLISPLHVNSNWRPMNLSCMCKNIREWAELETRR